MKEEITLLTEEQETNLEIFKKYGKGAKVTDFYIIQTGISCDGYGYYWTKTPDYDTGVNVSIVYSRHYFEWGDVDDDCIGIRPVISLAKIYEEKQNINKIIKNGIEEIEYGEYPQTIVNENLATKLEEKYQQKSLKRTKKKYTVILDEEKETVKEYEYMKNKYIRVKSSPFSTEEFFSNGKVVQEEKNYWIKVEPIKWLIDKKEEIAISKNILGTMYFSHKDDNNYETSDIKEFLEECFLKDIKPSKIKDIDMNKINELIELMSIVYDSKEEKKKVKRKV